MAGIVTQPATRARSGINIVVVGNYRPDRQYSMLAYEKAVMTALEGLEGVSVRAWHPPQVFGRGPGRLSRWLAGIDKFILPLFRAPSSDLALIVDQSNALYAFSLRARKVLIVCHDLVPALFAAGELPGWKPSFLRNLLTGLNLRALERADHVICVSEATRRDVLRLTRVAEDRTSTLLNAQTSLIGAHGGDVGPSSTDRPYVLCFGGWLTKNSVGSVRIFALAASRLPPGARLLMVGDLADAAAEEAARLGISDLFEVRRHVSDGDLVTLYRNASALLFPSLYEGFGWPILEAQACDTPVVCSAAASLPEVAGEGACVLPLSDEAAMANALVQVVMDGDFRAQIVAKGARNLARFQPGQWGEKLRDEVLSLLK